MSKYKTEYMLILEENKKLDEIENMKLEYRNQLLFENDIEVEERHQSKIVLEQPMNRTGSTILKPAKRGNHTNRKAFNGVYCLGKRMENN